MWSELAVNLFHWERGKGQDDCRLLRSQHTSRVEKPVRAVKALHITHPKPSIRSQEIPPYGNPSWDIHWTCPLNIVSNVRPAAAPLSSEFPSVESPEKAYHFNHSSQHVGRGRKINLDYYRLWRDNKESLPPNYDGRDDDSGRQSATTSKHGSAEVKRRFA